METWKNISGYDGLYEVSTSGSVKALAKEWYSGDNGQIFKTKKEHLLSQQTVIGYKAVVLTKDGVQKMCRVHRLVASAFIDNPEKKPEVNHINGIKTDNRVENLEWATSRENQLHAFKNGLQVSKKRGGHSQATKVKCETYDICFDCLKDAADAFGLTRYSIGRVCRGMQRFVNGLTFRYI